MNFFKILVPSYNNQDWVEYNLSSLISQTYQNYHVYYLDDASTDNTYEIVKNLVGNNPKFTIIKKTENTYPYGILSFFEYLDDDDIYMAVCGDDWLYDEKVLENLNNFYNLNDYWLTYGKYYIQDESHDLKEGYPQNTCYPDFVHEYKLYRRDVWRASHLFTSRGFLIKKLNLLDVISKKNGKWFTHASDLAVVYPLLEMCKKEKIGVVNFPTYVLNRLPIVNERTMERETSDNMVYELEIRNKKHYKEYFSGEKVPQVNSFTFREANSIPKKFSYVYNLSDGEFDLTLLEDSNILKYLNGEIIIKRGKIVADLHEPPHLFDQLEVYNLVKKNYKKFDLILTYDESLLELPNAKFRNAAGEVVLNKNVHKTEWPIHWYYNHCVHYVDGWPNLADENLYSLYSKNKLVSFITSNKSITDFHRFRINCVNFLADNHMKVDLFGVGFNEVRDKLVGLKDYSFSIAIENGSHKNYFTEKILDCFLTGTIPIYKGCPNIEQFFDIRGIIIFETLEELLDIIKNLDYNLYRSKQEYIENNFNTALSWYWNNDIYFDKYLKHLVK